MDTVLKILWFLGSGAAAVFYSFLLGCLLGIALWRWLRKPIPLKYQEVVNQLDALESELDKTDDTVEILWKKRFRLNSRKPSVLIIDTNEEAPDSEPISPLITRIINVKRRLVNLRGDMDWVLQWLSETPSSPDPTGNRPSSNQGKATVLIEAGQTNPQISPNVVDPLTGSPVRGESSRQNNRDWAKDVRSGGEQTSAQIAGANVEAEIVALYNRAVNDPQERERLREEYQPIRFGTVNAVERRQNPTIKAEFRETTDGDFFAFAIPGSNEYVVVPRLGVTIESVGYSAGALGEVFDKTEDHDPKVFYSRYRVLEPAIFTHEDDRWVLVEPGKLDLGPGD